MLGLSVAEDLKLGLQSPGEDRDKQKIALSLRFSLFQLMENPILISETPPVFILYERCLYFCVLFLGFSPRKGVFILRNTVEFLLTERGK